MGERTKLGIRTIIGWDDMKHDYCKGTPEEMEKWIVDRVKVEFRNGYREALGLPINEKEPLVKSKISGSELG